MYTSCKLKKKKKECIIIVYMFNFLGSYCSTPGLAAVTGPCATGYYCTMGASRPDPQNDHTGGLCPVGHYCPEGTGDPERCPPGYFSNSTGNFNFSDCKPCPEGKKTLLSFYRNTIA